MRLIVDRQQGKRLEAQLLKLPKVMLDASAVGQHNAAQDTMQVAKDRAPFEDGALSNAAYVNDPRWTGRGVVVEMGFAGVPYMVRQHEDLSYNHPGVKSKTSDPGRAAKGQPKFLETAVNDTAAQTHATIAKAVDFYLRTGRLPAMTGSIGPKP